MIWLSKDAQSTGIEISFTRQALKVTLLQIEELQKDSIEHLMEDSVFH